MCLSPCLSRYTLWDCNIISFIQGLRGKLPLSFGGRPNSKHTAKLNSTYTYIVVESITVYGILHCQRLASILWYSQQKSPSMSHFLGKFSYVGFCAEDIARRSFWEKQNIPSSFQLSFGVSSGPIEAKIVSASLSSKGKLGHVTSTTQQA